MLMLRALICRALGAVLTPVPPVYHSLADNNIGKGDPKGAIALAEAFATTPSLTSVE